MSKSRANGVGGSMREVIMSAVKWMGEGYPPDPGATKGAEVKKLLVELGVLGADNDKVTVAKTPESLQVITAGATAISKGWSTLAGVGLGGSALISGLKALNWLPGADVAGSQQVALTVSAALLASVAAIAIALIVRGDVVARAMATAAEYRARASIAQSLVGAFSYAHPTTAVLTTAGNWHFVREFSWEMVVSLQSFRRTSVSAPVIFLGWVNSDRSRYPNTRPAVPSAQDMRKGAEL